MYKKIPKAHNGFTLIELLVVLAVIGVLAAVIFMSVEDTRIDGRDAARKSQLSEILKAMELTLSDNNGMYPYDGNAAAGGGNDLTDPTLQAGFIGAASSQYMKKVPEDAARYYYCSSSDRRSIMIAINTENDKGGSEYCRVVRGEGSGADGYGCTAWMNTNASDFCATRF